MFRILVPVDGSDNSDHAVEYLITKAARFAEPLEIHLLNVQHSFPGTIRGVQREAQQVHHDEGVAALASARKLLDDAGIKYIYHIGLGDAAEVISHYAKEKRVDQIVMATHGRGAMVGLLMGSVARKVLHLVGMPVLLVK